MNQIIHCQLWMGSLEPYMTENFIMAAFRKMGEDPQTVKLMRNKYTGEPAGYCFVHFQTDEIAVDAMHKLNGKPIPGTNPIVRFRLNSASNQSKLPGNEREYSVWVGDLSSDVDDYSLYRVFSSKYTSIKTAKVILDSSGFSKGYGFVRFGLEDEQQAALYEMNGYIGLGTKALKICNAVPKPKTATTTPTSPTPTPTVSSSYGSGTDYSQYYDPNYWQGYTAWQGYYDQSQADQSAYYAQNNTAAVAHAAENWAAQQQYEQQHDDDDLALVEHKFVLETDKLNRELVERDRNLWDALESSKWLPIEQLELVISKMGEVIRKRNISCIPAIESEGVFFKQMPRPPKPGKPWMNGLEPYERLFYQQTLSSARRFAGFKPYPFIPRCSVDIALASTYAHGSELFPDKVDVVLQPATRGMPPVPLGFKLFADKVDVVLQPETVGQSTFRRIRNTTDVVTQPEIAIGHPIQYSGITERISPHSVKLMNSGPHTPLTNPGYSRQDGDGNYYRY